MHVEGSVGVVSTWILVALRNQHFLSLKNLNEAIRERLAVFNNKPFQKKKAAEQNCFGRSSYFCFLCRLHPLRYPSGKSPLSSITTM